MDLTELTAIIQTAGGRTNALDYADKLLAKIKTLEATGRYEALFNQLRSARQPGDFRGRVLEINYAERFVTRGHDLIYGADQGMDGDVDLLWGIAGQQIFQELKLLGQDQATHDAINAQLARGGISTIHFDNDVSDIVRLQRDMVQKATVRKFSPKPQTNWVNLVVIDVAELQLGTMDVADCLLAAGGNPLVSRHFNDVCRRDEVVGVFEMPGPRGFTPAQKQWIMASHLAPMGQPHPREYIHGALFLFRRPKETAALAYELTSVLVWNPALITRDRTPVITEPLYDVIPPEPMGDANCDEQK